MLSCARLAAHAEGLAAPDLPGQQPTLGVDAPEPLRAIVTASSELYRQSAEICRPSESFDVRWEDGWRRLERSLNVLESRLGAAQIEYA